QTFRIRFRLGTDTKGGAPGWEIDNVAFTGIVGTPFPTLVADAGHCLGAPSGGSQPGTGGTGTDPGNGNGGPGGPDPGNGGPGSSGASGCQVGGEGAGSAVALGLVIVLLRRRRR